MENHKHLRHHMRHLGYSYPVSFSQRLYSIFSPIALLVVLFLALKLFSVFPFIATAAIPFDTIITALLATMFRLAVAYALAVIVAIPLAMMVSHSSTAERLLLPLFDIVQSIPALAFFPLIILVFIRFGFINGAAIFIIFMSMLWNMVFALVGGLKSIPGDIKAAAHVFGLRGTDMARRVLLPAVVPYLITGSILAWAQGWNIIIVAEVLHTYIPGSLAATDLFGIGSILVNASAAGQNTVFAFAILSMVGMIALLNFFVWQKLLHYAERFKFE